jgi:hypothetical protein
LKADACSPERRIRNPSELRDGAAIWSA